MQNKEIDNFPKCQHNCLLQHLSFEFYKELGYGRIIFQEVSAMRMTKAHTMQDKRLV